MQTILQFLIQSLPIFVFIAVPGFLAALALLRKVKLGYLELLFLGIPIGMALPAIMAFLESLIGIQYSSTLPLINAAVISLISIFAIYKQGIEILPKSLKIDRKTAIVYALLLIIVFLAFWIRLQGISPVYYEFDPYWYNQVTQFIITEGGVPLHDDLVWYPNPSTHRTVPLVPYMEADWYSVFEIFNGMKGFDFTTMTMVSSLYPPITAALISAFVFIWLSREYGRPLGLVAASLLAFTPIFVDKTLAGVFELAPWGFFTIVLFYLTYFLMMKTNSRRFALLAAFALGIAVLGAPARIIPMAVFMAVLPAIALIKYFKQEKIEKEFLINNGIIAGVTFLAALAQTIYVLDIAGPLSNLNMMGGMLSFIFVLALSYLQNISKNLEDRLLYLSVLFIVGIIIAILTPIGNIGVGLISGVVEISAPVDPTFKTIAEQGTAGTDFSSVLNILGTNINFLGITISITPIILVISFLLTLFAIYTGKNRFILAAIGIQPIAIAGLIRTKYFAYLGLMTPIAFVMLIGEIVLLLKMKNITVGGGKYEKPVRSVFWGVLLLVVLGQFLPYYDVTLSSVGFATMANIENNLQFNSLVCGPKINEFNQIAQSIDTGQISSLIGTHILTALFNTRRIYCNRVPDSWLNSMEWIKDNVGKEERVISWWDYGHWINSFGQGKSVTGNTHEYSLMHQEVGDLFVRDTPEHLISYMKDHKAKYLLLDSDLIGKWGALVYHSCFYTNQTSIDAAAGTSECEFIYGPEIAIVSKNPTEADLCTVRVSGNDVQGLKVYSGFIRAAGIESYCAIFENDSVSVRNLDGSLAGIDNIVPQSSDATRDIIMLLYNSNNPNRKGKYYDSIFYKGFFEGEIPGFEQVYPQVVVPGQSPPVRIYRLRD